MKTNLELIIPICVVLLFLFTALAFCFCGLVKSKKVKLIMFKFFLLFDVINLEIKFD